MPPERMSDPLFLEKQYKDSSNLDARIKLHQQFSRNKYGWHLWVFDQFKLPPQCRILELGSGAGHLWTDNLDRIPSGWEIVLSDSSPGMLEQARRKLKGRREFEYRAIDAQSIPFEGRLFDAVVANHMLYHVPDRLVALSEIRRVLKLEGRFYASTVGERHLIEIADLIGKFDAELTSWGRVADSFTLENGLVQLSERFGEISLYRNEDALEVTEAAPLVDYILSGWAHLAAERQNLFREFVAQEMESQGGVFTITKDSGLFEAVRSSGEQA